MQNEEHSLKVSEDLTVSVEAFQREAAHLKFDASCELQTAQFLSTLAASKPGGASSNWERVWASVPRTSWPV